MQERGDLVHDPDGYWIEGQSLDWDALPARVEGVLEERINRIRSEVQELLTVASVEGGTLHGAGAQPPDSRSTSDSCCGC